MGDRLQLLGGLSPLGPYQYKGAYIDEYRGHSGTIHGSVVEYKDQWYAFYHSGWGTGSESCRSLMLDHLFYDGKQNQTYEDYIKVTPLGVPSIWYQN